MTERHDINWVFFQLIEGLPKPDFYEMWDPKTRECVRTHNGVGSKAVIHPMFDLNDQVYGRVAWHVQVGDDMLDTSLCVMEISVDYERNALAVQTGHRGEPFEEHPGYSLIGITGQVRPGDLNVFTAETVYSLIEEMAPRVERLFQWRRQREASR